MKTIGSITDLLSLQSDLAMFVLLSCPWMGEQWDPKRIGYVFIIDDSDINEVTSIWTAPHQQASDESYRAAMTIDLSSFDLWESPAIFDEVTGYWNVVAILGEEYGCTLFLSSEYVKSIPALHNRLIDIRQMRYGT